MSNLRALRISDISPQILLQTLSERIDEIQDMYVVTFMPDGTAMILGTADEWKMPAAAALLTEAFVSLHHAETP